MRLSEWNIFLNANVGHSKINHCNIWWLCKKIKSKHIFQNCICHFSVFLCYCCFKNWNSCIQRWRIFILFFQIYLHCVWILWKKNVFIFLFVAERGGRGYSLYLLYIITGSWKFSLSQIWFCNCLFQILEEEEIFDLMYYE